MRSRMAAGLLLFYKRVLSPALHAVPGLSGACRFQPTCSEYAAIAVAEHGLVRGTMMSLGRLARCHPLHRGGFDPVPLRRADSITAIKARPTP
ncbi:MAG: membrane protein insertion efficiency factor YidD [Acidobacteriaceae bacterium]